MLVIRNLLPTHSSPMFFLLVIISFGENTLEDGTPEDWARVKELALDIANNGQKEGENCERKPSNYAAMEIARFTYSDLAGMAQGNTLADVEKILGPNTKYVACAAKLNLLCSGNQCKSCNGIWPYSDLELCNQRVKPIVEKLV